MKAWIAVFLLGATFFAQAEGVRFQAEGGWVTPLVPEEAQAYAGYAVLINEGDQPLRLIGVGSTDFLSAEFREHYVEDGVSATRTLSSIEVPAHGRLVLDANGIHLFLRQPSRRLSSAGMVLVDLLTAEEDPLPVVLSVRRDAPVDGSDGN